MNIFARRLVLTPRQMKKTTQEWPIGGLGVCCNLVPRAFTLAWGQDKGPGNEVGYVVDLPKNMELNILSASTTFAAIVG